MICFQYTINVGCNQYQNNDIKKPAVQLLEQSYFL